MKFKNLILILSTFLMVSVNSFAFDNPKTMLEQTTTTILAKIEENEEVFKQDNSKLYDFVETEIIPHVDVEYTSKLVLGKNWRVATEDQRKEFQQEFTSFLVKTYASGLFAYDGQEISFGEPRYNNEKDKAIVEGEINSQNGKIKGEFKLKKNGNEWKLYNADVESINLISNFRTSYNEIINQKGIDGLISDLKTKNQQYQ